jgi:tRNA threonylcarbamoyladenosine biosynthesis protein TsaB
MPASEPRLLILETSGRAGLVGLAQGNRVLSQRWLEESRRQARDLVPFIAELLSEQGWNPRDLTAVVVSLGPGSYTGLRVGVISAKVLGYTTGCVVLGIPTFQAIARQAPVSHGRIDVLADAQKDRVYTQSFLRDDRGALLPAGELRIVTWDEWAKTCPAGTVITGPGALKYPDRVPRGVAILAPDVREPQLESLLALALERLERSERDDPFALEPLYLRPSSAEEQWDARGSKT